jgi:hypothetical protein
MWAKYTGRGQPIRIGGGEGKEWPMGIKHGKNYNAHTFQSGSQTLNINMITS